MSKVLKEIIIPKIQSATLSLINNNHSRVNICDFSTIQHKKIGSQFAFFNEVYSKVSSFFIIIIEISRVLQ